MAIIINKNKKLDNWKSFGEKMITSWNFVKFYSISMWITQKKTLLNLWKPYFQTARRENKINLTINNKKISIKHLYHQPDGLDGFNCHNIDWWRFVEWYDIPIDQMEPLQQSNHKPIIISFRYKNIHCYKINNHN